MLAAGERDRIPSQTMRLSNFAAALAENGLPELRRSRVETLQVNVGKRCDLACHHCHVEAGPRRTESMDERTAARESRRSR